MPKSCSNILDAKGKENCFLISLRGCRWSTMHFENVIYSDRHYNRETLSNRGATCFLKEEILLKAQKHLTKEKYFIYAS